MNIFVTGGCGFIGSHLVEYHLERGDTVQTLDDLSAGREANIESFKKNPNFRFDKGDISTWPHLKEAIKKADRIYHMASVVGVFQVLAEPVQVISTNIQGSIRLFESIVDSHTRPQVIIASSSMLYGNTEKPYSNEENHLIFHSANQSYWRYAISKLAEEAIGLAYYQRYDIPTILVRLFNVVGPRQTGRYGMVMPRFVGQACEGKPLTVYGDGTQLRSFCDVRDTVAAMVLLAENNVNGEIVNVGHDQSISINDLAEMVRAEAKSKSDIIHISYKEAYGENFEYIKDRRPDLSKLYQLTGFKHRWTLKETINDLISRYLNTQEK